MHGDPVEHRIAEVAAAMQELLHSLVEIQPLTGLPNKRALDHRLASLPDEQPAAILAVEVNGFKNLNDRHTHQGGDMILIEIALRLQEVCESRAGATAFHLSGDEFAVLAPGLDKPRALDLGEELKNKLEAHRFPIPGSAETDEHEVTVCVGLAHRDQAGTPHDRARLHDQADRLVECLKQTGRTGRVWSADDEALQSDLQRFASASSVSRRRVSCPECTAWGYLNLPSGHENCNHGNLRLVDDIP